MFGKLTVEVDKASVIAAIAFVSASCACLMIRNGLELIIKGCAVNQWPRLKGFLLVVLGLGLLSMSLLAVLKSDQIARFLMQYVESLPFLG